MESTAIQPQPIESSGGGNPFGFLNRQLSVKNLLIGGVIVYALYSFWKKNKDSAYARALLQLEKNPLPNSTTVKGIESIRYKVDEYVATMQPDLSDEQIQTKVMQLTTA